MFNRWLKNGFEQIKNSAFNKNFVHVFSGNLIGGGIYAISIPVVANLYPVAAFGVFQLLLSMSASLSPSSVFRFEKLIILAETDNDFKVAFNLCIASLVFTVLLFGVALMLFANLIFAYWGAPEAAHYYYLAVICLLLEGLMLIVSEFALREKMFSEYSVYRVLSLSLFGLLPIVFSLISTSFSALFASRLVAYAVCITYLVIKTGLLKKIALTPFAEIKDMAIKNYKFPVYNTPGTFLNNFSVNIPVFLLSRYFGQQAVGIYSMANRIVQMPLSIVSSAMTNVFFRTAVDEHKKGQLKGFFTQTLKKVSIIGLLPLVFLPFMPQLSAMVLGEDWRQTGVYLQVLYPALLMSFIATPISGTFIILKRQEIILWMAAIATVIRFLSIYFLKDSSSIAALLSYSIFSVLYYVIFIYTMYKAINNSRSL